MAPPTLKTSFGFCAFCADLMNGAAWAHQCRARMDAAEQLVYADLPWIEKGTELPVMP